MYFSFSIASYKELVSGSGLRVELHAVLKRLDRHTAPSGSATAGFDGSTGAWVVPLC
jgi:hypothetical protein